MPRESDTPRTRTLERTRAHTVHSAGLTERPTAGPGKQTNKWRGREGSQETGGESACASFPRCDAALFPTQNSPSAELAASHSELSECGQKRFRKETLRHVGSRASRCGGCLLVLSYSSAVNLSEGDLHSTLPLLVVETAFGDCIEARKGGEVPREATPPD